MQKPIETVNIPSHMENGVQVGEQVLKIYQDEDSMNPRTDVDNFGKMICFHDRYSLGDDHDINYGDFDGWDEIREYLIREKKAAVILPLYLYDHSGITMRTTPFQSSWDSGKVGYIYATRQDIIEEFGDRNRVTRQNVTKYLKEKAEALLVSEVEVYDDYLTGNVYGYELTDTDGEVIDSCWGFFGDDAVERIKKDVLMQHRNTANVGEVPAVVT